VGVFWFYWVSFSLRFAGLTLAIPLEIFFIALTFGVIFMIAGLFSNLLLRALCIVAFGYTYPLNFNWLNFELIFVGTPFFPSPLVLFGVLIGLVFLRKTRGVLLALVLACSANLFWASAPNELPFKAKFVETNVPQNLRWNANALGGIVAQNFALIEEAIREKNRLVVLPETAFPLVLNANESVVKRLRALSQEIAILTGALAYENGVFYNSAFLFDKGEMRRFDKVVLVPFGETNPLPKFLARPLNRFLFGTEDDLTPASAVSDYEVSGVKFRNAICYEATRPEIYEGKPKFVIAISNNAWFLPSTQMVLQNLHIRRFELLHGTKVFHAVNR